MSRATSLRMIVGFLMMASCGTTVDGIRISGHSGYVSPEDIRWAIAACSDSGAPRKVNPWQIEVASKNEIHVYWLKPNATSGGYDIAKRGRGKWTCKETVVTVLHERD